MARGDGESSILYGDFRLQKPKNEIKEIKVPRIKNLNTSAKEIGLEEWIEGVKGWSGGHFWIIKKDKLLDEWKKEGKKINEPNDFLALISRAKAHLSALGKTEAVSFSKDLGGAKRAEPMRDVISKESESKRYVNSYYLEAALRALGREPQRWHIASLNSRATLVGYEEEDPVIILALAR